ncbi:hypothetical protein [Luteitalea sp.]|jgi:tetratricopeptide (TPR) repeat protein|uniref:hypothetical protein n=1 Tax=Luteitalea sp. TaxID=2004800 RepID=UPI0037C859F7
MRHEKRGARRRALGVVGVVLAALVLMTTGARAQEVGAQKNWKRLETPNFDIVGTAGERDLRGLADRLEQFRQAMEQIFPDLKKPAARRARVVAFGNQRAFEQFSPPRPPNAPRISGYYLPGEDMSHMVLNLEDLETHMPVLYWEYVHLLMDDQRGALPLWASQGLASYFATFQAAYNREQAYVGRPDEAYVTLLRQSFLPLPAVIAATRESPEYTRKDRRDIFEAESWALIHYLFLGNQQRYAAKAQTFVAVLAAGRPLDAAAQEQLGVPAAQLERELRAYIDVGRFMQQVVTFDERLTKIARLPVTAIPEADAHALLGDLLQRLDLGAASQAQVARALALDPGCPVANEVQARSALKEGRHADARTFLERAAASDRASSMTHYQLAAVLEDDLQAASSGDARALQQRQEQAVRRSIALNPAFADAHHLLALVLARDPARTGEAILAEQQALTLVPSRDVYILGLAQLRAQANDVAAAKALARMAATRTRDDALRSDATGLAAELEAYQKHQARIAAAERTHGVKVSDAGMSFTQTRPRLAPDFISAAAGQRRGFGYLVRVECSAGAPTYVVDVEGTLVRLTAAAPAALKLVTFREDLTGDLGCGPRATLDALYATWQPAPDEATPGTAVALEFVPRGYVPPR